MMRRNYAHLLFVVALIVFLIGTVMVYNASSAEILDRALNRNLQTALMKQLLYAVVGGGISYLVWKVGFDHLLTMSPILYCMIVLCLLLVFVPGLGVATHGARRWLRLGGITVQPSEFVKLILPMFCIRYLSTHTMSWPVFMKLFCFLVAPLALILMEPDNGTVAVLVVVILVVFFIARVPWKFWVLPMCIVGILGGTIAYQLPYVRGRIDTYLHPHQDLQGKGHQPFQAKIATGSGRLTGRGLGQSLQKLTYLPEAQNDYIAAIYAEETGFVGVLILILCYMVMTFCGFAIALQVPREEYSWLVAALATMVFFQAFCNFGVVSGLLPSKGVNLPLFSQGGTSLIVNMITITMMVHVAKKETTYCS